MSSLKLSRFRALLVGTKIPENIGSFARLLENYGVKEAGLVAPNCEWKTGVAQWMATSHSNKRLNSLPVYEKLEDAILDCSAVVGFTARAGKTRKSTIKLEDLGKKISGRVALVFGREDFCLLKEEADLCTHLCALDTNPEFPTLNLSHSVAVVLSQLFNQENDSRRGHFKPVTMKELEPMMEHLREVLIEAGLNKDGNPNKMLKRMRDIFIRAEVTKQDVALFRGFYSKVQKKMGVKR